MSHASKGASLNASAPEWRPASFSQPAAPPAPEPPVESKAIEKPMEPEIDASEDVVAPNGPRRSLRPGGSATGRWARGQKLVAAPEEKVAEANPGRWDRGQKPEASEEAPVADVVDNWRSHASPLAAAEAFVDPRGRRVYTIDSLIQLRPREDKVMPLSNLNVPELDDKQSRPALLRSELPDIEANGRESKAFPGNGGQRDGPNGSGGSRGNHSGARKNRRGRDREQETAPPLDECEPLAINEETRWKAKVMDPNATLDEQQVFERQLLSLLNRLTLERFAKISAQVVELAKIVEGEEQLSILASAIVEKAQNEQHFCAMYAELCRTMAAQPLLDDQADKPRAFQKELLSRCQQEFDDDLATRMQRAAEYATEQEMDEGDRNIHLIKTKRQYLGHMKFLGELFQKDLLKEKIVHEVVQILLGAEGNKDEESLECLCKLLKTVGYKLEYCAQKMKYREFIGFYFKTLEDLGKDSTLPSRVRFMCKDVVELRGNNYELRRKEEVAKTIREVRAEAAAEQERQDAIKNRNGRSKKGGKKGDRVSSKDLQRTKSPPPASLPPTTTADGWNIASGSTKTKTTSKPKLRPAPSLPSTASTSSSMFSMLNMDASEERKEKKKKKKKEKKEKEEKKKKSKKDRSDSARDVEDLTPEVSPAPSPSPVPQKSIEAAKRGCWEAVEEYEIGRDEPEMLRCLGECALALENGEGAWLVPNTIMSKSFEHKEQARTVAIECVGKGAKEGVRGFDRASLERAINDQLELMWDFKIDIPRIEDYIASYVGVLLAQNSLELKFLETSPESFRRPDLEYNPGANAAEFVVKCVVSAKSNGCENVQELLEAGGGFDYSTCLPEGTEDAQAVGSEMMSAALA